MAPNQSPQREASLGVFYGLTAYLLWGIFPLYFTLFDPYPAWEILIHRIIWSCVFLAIVISFLGRWQPVIDALKNPKALGFVLACAILIAINWLVYIYSVGTRQVLQASLGYFLTPLVNVALGMLILRERIKFLQGVAIVLATLAVLYQLVLLGIFPWITLVLAFSFGTYGLMRKKVALDGLSGLFVETLLLLPFGILAWATISSLGLSNWHQNGVSMILFVSVGIATALPLLAFAGGARRLNLSTIGFLMYINPTIQFLIARFVFEESLSSELLASFVVIWLALALYSGSAWFQRSSLKPT
jgi:chloramphenicol-sensitive protein RarD